MKCIETAVYRQLLIGTIIGVLGLIDMTLVTVAVINLLVEYRGNTIRKSTMLAERPGEVFCQQLASFSLGVMSSSFDSEAGLDAFSENH